MPHVRFPSNPVSDVLQFRTPSPASEEDSPLPQTPPMHPSPGSSSTASTPRESEYALPRTATPYARPAALHPAEYSPQPLVYTPSPSGGQRLSPLPVFTPNMVPTPSPKTSRVHLHPALHGQQLAALLAGQHADVAHKALASPATSPAFFELTLRCDDRLPWKIVVTPPYGGVVTVGDVVAALCAFLARRVHQTEFDSERTERRAAISLAFDRRTHGNAAERGNGLRRLDFLEGRAIVGFQPLAQASDDVFELVLR